MDGGMRNVFHRGRRKPDLSGQGNGGAGLPDRR